MRSDNYQREIKIVTNSGPSAEPLTVAELKARLRIDHSSEDDLIESLGKAARELIEGWTGCRMMTRTEYLYLDSFPPCDAIVIPVAPVTAVASVKLYDEDDAATTMAAADYMVDLKGHVAAVRLKSGKSWPTIDAEERVANAVEVAFTSGYASAGAVPERLKTALHLLTAHLYENREATTPLELRELPMGLQTVILPFVVWERKL